MIYSSRAEQKKGRELSLGLVARGNWGAKELRVRQKMSGLSCLEVCNYNLMSDCAQFGIQKLLSASEAGNAGGASLPQVLYWATLLQGDLTREGLFLTFQRLLSRVEKFVLLLLLLHFCC